MTVDIAYYVVEKHEKRVPSAQRIAYQALKLHLGAEHDRVVVESQDQHVADFYNQIYEHTLPQQSIVLVDNEIEVVYELTCLVRALRPGLKEAVEREKRRAEYVHNRVEIGGEEQALNQAIVIAEWIQGHWKREAARALEGVEAQATQSEPGAGEATALDHVMVFLEVLAVARVIALCLETVYRVDYKSEGKGHVEENVVLGDSVLFEMTYFWHPKSIYSI